MKKRTPSYIEKQKHEALIHSPAGRLAIRMISTLDKLDLAGNMPKKREIHKKLNKYCKDNALKLAQAQIEEISGLLLEDGRVPPALILGATFVWRHFDAWFDQGKKLPYKNLRIEELQELARLRGVRIFHTKDGLVK